MATLFDGLPEIYRAFLPPEVYSHPIPEETKATCSSCAMCESTCGSKLSPTPDTSESTVFFSPNTKCCTYHPMLPGYLVGAILRDETPEMQRGRDRILEKIAKRTGVTPYGINAPGLYTLKYQNGREFFGRSTDMLCPYYLDESGGLCSIWRHREAVCSTYFCKHVAGADGRRFYSSVKYHLALVEQKLSKFIIHELYPDYLALDLHPADPPARRLERAELEGQPLPEATHKKIWGNWTGMEREFFEESFEIVRQLTPEKARAILGIDGAVSLSGLQRTLKAMTAPELPKRLKLADGLTVRYEKEEVILGAYSELDALALPSVAFEYLQEFKRPADVTEVRARLRREKQTDFSDEVLLALYQHRVLAEP